MQTILIVDDDESFHFLCEIQFRKSQKDYKLLKAYDGVEALELLRTTNVSLDLILLDINMPRMDGHEFLVEFSKFNTGEIPIVAMLTSSDQERDKQQALAHRFVKDYVIKPIRKEHITKLDSMVQEIKQRMVHQQ